MSATHTRELAQEIFEYARQVEPGEGIEQSLRYVSPITGTDYFLVFRTCGVLLEVNDVRVDGYATKETILRAIREEVRYYAAEALVNRSLVSFFTEGVIVGY